MLTKIVNEPSSRDKILSGDEVTLAQLSGLSGNFFLKVHIEDNGRKRPMDSSNPRPHTDWSKRDTEAIYFPKDKIMEFFSENTDSDGLKIYLGLHAKSIYPGMKEEKYENKVMVVLVAMKGDDEMMNVNDKVIVGGGAGMDNGTLCPPDPHCL